MICATLTRAEIQSQRDSLSTRYCQAFSAAPWNENWTSVRAAAHLTRMVERFGAEVIAVVDERDRTPLAFECVTILGGGSGILSGLHDVGARAGDCYLSELVVNSIQEADDLVRALIAYASSKGCQRIWVRAHLDAAHYQHLYRLGFLPAKIFTHNNQRWVAMQYTVTASH